MKIDQIVWLNKKSAGMGSDSDVTITATKNKCFRLSFSNEVLNSITKLDCIGFGVAGKRLYFIENDNGYKTSETSPHRKTAHCGFREDLLPFTGQHPIFHDNECNLYYISADNIE